MTIHRPFRAVAGVLKALIVSALLWIPIILILAMVLVQPTFRTFPASTRHVSPDGLQNHVLKLAREYVPRNYMNMWNMDAAGIYIRNHFRKSGGRISEQTFHTEGAGEQAGRVRNNTYRNVIASFGPEEGPRIIVGAHYDAAYRSPGADDNASGTAGLIELAYLLGRTELKQRVDLVALTLEEPPFFGTEDMGSARHAEALQQDGADVTVMICLEMIGYFSDEPASQRFPSSIIKWLYPDRGNYIAVVGGIGDHKLIRGIKASMRSATDLPVHAMCAPRRYGGLDFSDHRNYWSRGFNAVMVTDTAFYRNSHYHKESDVPETLDYDRMAKVVIGVYEAVVRLANGVD